MDKVAEIQDKIALIVDKLLKECKAIDKHAQGKLNPTYMN